MPFGHLAGACRRQKAMTGGRGFGGEFRTSNASPGRSQSAQAHRAKPLRDIAYAVVSSSAYQIRFYTQPGSVALTPQVWQRADSASVDIWRQPQKEAAREQRPPGPGAEVHPPNFLRSTLTIVIPANC